MESKEGLQRPETCEATGIKRLMVDRKRPKAQAELVTLYFGHMWPNVAESSARLVACLCVTRPG